MAERFVLDKSDCVDGGDGCKAEMRHSVAGAFVYHSEIEKVRAGVAGRRLNERCEWNPVLRVASLDPPRDTDCHNETWWSIGHGDRNFHVCDSCAKLPEFKLRSRKDPINANPAATSSTTPAEPSIADAIAKVREMRRDWRQEELRDDEEGEPPWCYYVSAADYVIKALESLAPAERTGEQGLTVDMETVDQFLAKVTEARPVTYGDISACREAIRRIKDATVADKGE